MFLCKRRSLYAQDATPIFMFILNRQVYTGGILLTTKNTRYIKELDDTIFINITEKHQLFQFKMSPTATRRFKHSPYRSLYCDDCQSVTNYVQRDCYKHSIINMC